MFGRTCLLTTAFTLAATAGLCLATLPATAAIPTTDHPAVTARVQSYQLAKNDSDAETGSNAGNGDHGSSNAGGSGSANSHDTSTETNGHDAKDGQAHDTTETPDHDTKDAAEINRA